MKGLGAVAGGSLTKQGSSRKQLYKGGIRPDLGRPTGAGSVAPSSGARDALDLRPPRVELVRGLLVLRAHGGGVDLGEAEDAHLLVALTDRRSPQPDVPDHRDDAAEEA